jgi:C-terminal processing protease CtpA/Prc
LILMATLSLSLSLSASGQTVYEQDVAFALDQLESNCGRFFALKKIDWPAVRKQFAEEAKTVGSDEQHLVLLTRLLARVKDGHAVVRPTDKTKDMKPPASLAQPDRTGPGMFWCTIGQDAYVKKSFASARDAGVRAGMQVLEVDGKPARQWLEARVEQMSDTRSFSTPQQAMFHTCHWGLAQPAGTTMRLKLKPVSGDAVDVTVTYRRASTVPDGPAVFPRELKGDGDVAYATLPSGFGYVHVRRCKADLPQRMDEALEALGNLPGLVLDLRANGGGGFDHEALMGRFVPAGRTMSFAKAYRSAGPRPYGGLVVLIIDGNVRSAGETLAAIFKEDGRAYVIGESATAGTSSQKTTIDLPSGLFGLYVSTRSNMARSNGGKGIEGVGIPPHEVISYDPQDLSAGVDTLTKRAEDLLRRYPQEQVPYNPEEFGWKAR